MTIFEQPWWINAATDGAFHRVRFNDGESVSAEMIVVSSREHRLDGFSMPRLARVWSPRIEFGNVRPKNELPLQVKALRGLLAELPAHDHINYMLPPESDLVVAHDLAGFEVKPAFTFRANPGQDVMGSMDQKIRYNIRSGAKRIQVLEHGDIDRYIDLSDVFVKDRAFRNHYDYDAIRRVHAASAEHGQSTILSAIDASGKDIAGAILLWDDETLYYWMNCRRPDSNDYVANSVLIWKAILIAKERNIQFDMDGYATANAGIFFSRFGLAPKPRFAIQRVSPRYAFRKTLYAYSLAAVGTEVRGKLLAARNRLAEMGLRRRVAQPAPRAVDARTGPRDEPDTVRAPT